MRINNTLLRYVCLAIALSGSAFCGTVTVGAFTQAAIVSAISSACNGTVAGTVIFPNGTYPVGSAISIPSVCTLQAQNQGVPIIQGSQNQVFSVNGDTVTINGLVLDAGRIAGAQGRQYHDVAITNNTIRNWRNSSQGGGPEMINFWALLRGNISNNFFSNIWGGGNLCCTIALVGSESIDQFGALGMKIDSADQTTIANNTFDQIANDALKITWQNTTGNTGGYSTSGDVIAYNIFTNIHRIPIELQSQPGGSGSCPGGCNTSIVNTNGLQVKGNYAHNYQQPFYDTWGASLVPDGSKGSQYINNTWISSPVTGTGMASGQETSADNGLVQGEVIANNPGSSKGYGATLSYGSNSNPSFTILTQENIWCGNSWITHNGDWVTYEGTVGVNIATITERYVYKQSTGCPAGANPDTSGIVPTWTSADNQSFPSGGNGTWSLNVVSNLSIRYVQFFIDSSTTPIATQELQDLNTSFATDRKWLYHTTINTSTLTSAAHTMKAVATDVSGGLVTITQTFTVGSSTPVPIVSLSPSSLSFSAAGSQTVTLTNTGNAALTISGASITGANPGDFSDTTTCGSTVAASASCTYSVTFAPTTTGTRTATLAISNNSAVNPANVTLSGFTAAPATIIYQTATVPSGGLTVAPSTTLQPSTVTVTAWVQASVANTNYPAFISYGNDANSPFESYVLQASTIDGNNPADFYFLTNSTAGTDLHGTTKLSVGPMYFVAATYDGATAKIYLNGSLEGSLPLSGSLFYPVGVGGLGIARKYSPSSNGFNGTEQTVAIYNGALTAAQILTLYNSGPGTVSPPTTGTCNIPASLCTAQPGQSIALVASSPVTAWTKLPNAVGTLTVTDSTHATYTAPATIDKAKSSLGGCMILPNDSIYNTRIDAAPINSQSATWINAWGAVAGVSAIGWQPAWDQNVIDNATNTIASPQWFYTSGYNGQPFQLPNDINRKRENGAIAQGTIGFSQNQDHHLISINHQTCQIYETYQDQVPVAGLARGQSGSTCSQLSGINTGCTAQSGYQYNGYGYAVPSNGTSAAAGQPDLAMTWRADEVDAGAINHALRITIGNGYCATGFLWPATSQMSCGNSSAPPSGARLRMKASATCPQATAAATTTCTALKQYGAILDDITAGLEFTTSLDLWYDQNAKTLWTGNFNIPLSSLEFVDESALKLSANTYAVNPNNGFVVPSNSAVISTGGTTPTYQPIALMPVTVGVSEPYQALLSGFPYSPSAWVNGTSTTTVTWSATGGGSFAAGVYTPPVVAPGGNVVVTLTACSTVDPTACGRIHANVLPSKCKTADTTVRVCIDSGALASYGPDANGDTWSADATATGGSELFGSQSPGWQFETDGTLFYTGLGGTDIIYHFSNVPAGNYKVTLLQGRGYDNSGNPVCNFNQGWPASYYVPGLGSTAYGLNPWPGLPGNPMFLGTQGTITNFLHDPGRTYPVNNGYQCFVRSQVSIPALVGSDGALTPGMYSYWDSFAQYAPWVQAMKVEADNGTAPHLAIDLAGNSDGIMPAQTRQLYAQWWYLTPGTITWSVSGPGSISSTGLYTAPATQTLTGAAVITASDGNGHSVSQTLWVQGRSTAGALF